MGASASIIDDGSLPAEFQVMLELVDKQKHKISENDQLILLKESSKMFKGHGAIIDCLTSRTKHQLKKMYSSSPTNPEDIYKLIGTKDAYAKFISMLFQPKEKIEMDMIVASNNGDYDEELMISLIASSTVKEIKKLDALYAADKLHSIADIVETKTKKDTSIQKFFKLILQCDRDESKKVDLALAEKQAEDIHAAGAARMMGMDEEVILGILSKTSRAQCGAIADAYQKLFKMKIEKAINMKFKGNVAKLILAWIQPLPSAVAQLLFTLESKMIIDKLQITGHIAKYDKDFLQQVDSECQKQYQKPLLTIVQRGLSGNLFKAVKGWIENLTPDRGFERILDMFLESKRLSETGAESMNMHILTDDPETQQRVKFLLEKQSNELKKYLIDNKIRFDPNETFDAIFSSQASFDAYHSKNLPDMTEFAARTGAEGEGERKPGLSKAGSSTAANSASSNSLLERKASKASNNSGVVSPKGGNSTVVSPKGSRAPSPVKAIPPKFSMKSEQSGTEEYGLKSDKVYNFLSMVFTRHDVDNQGCFPVEKFWEIMKQLPLSELGLTESDIDAMQELCTEWEHEGVIYYYEAMIELSDSIITTIEAKPDHNNVMTVITQCTINEKRNARSESHQELLKAKGGADGKFLIRRDTMMQFQNIPAYFMQYLIDTMEAFDLNQNGYLSKDELAQLLEILNISIDLNDFSPEDVDFITPRMAAVAFGQHLNDWFLDKETDHYICLVDKESGAYFWYNTKDETSQWCVNSYDAAASPAAGAGVDPEPFAAANMSTKSQAMIENPQAVYVPDALSNHDSKRHVAISKSSPDGGASSLDRVKSKYAVGIAGGGEEGSEDVSSSSPRGIALTNSDSLVFSPAASVKGAPSISLKASKEDKDGGGILSSSASPRPTTSPRGAPTAAAEEKTSNSPRASPRGESAKISSSASAKELPPSSVSTKQLSPRPSASEGASSKGSVKASAAAAASEGGEEAKSEAKAAPEE